MNGLDLLSALAEKSAKHALVSEVEGGFDPIVGLKPGDRVKVKSVAHNLYKSFREDPENTVGIVHRVGNFNGAREDGAPVNEDDFTMLTMAGEVVVEMGFDSRRFKLAD